MEDETLPIWVYNLSMVPRYQILMNQRELYEAWEERVGHEMKIYVSNKVVI